MYPDLIVRRPQGLYCPPGDFYIDPWRPVPRAVITHAHADHARRGHGAYLATAQSAGVLRARLGDISLQGLAYGEAVQLNGVRISLHPAGHVLGSAQVRLEHRGQVWVASGDYFVSGIEGDHNPSCVPFEPVRCHTFITESTFGLPLYRWAAQADVVAQVNAWWAANAAAGRPSLLMAYSFGKAQRLLAMVDAGIGPIAVHSAVEPVNQAYREAGIPLPATRVLPPETRRADATADRSWLAQALVVAPPSVHASAWARRLGDFSDAFASGWMALRGARRRQGVDRGFVLSDHADWPGLQRAIAATGAQRVIVTHGFEAVMVRWLHQQGLQAESFHTEYGDESGAETAPAQAPVMASTPLTVAADAPMPTPLSWAPPGGAPPEPASTTVLPAPAPSEARAAAPAHPPAPQALWPHAADVPAAAAAPAPRRTRRSGSARARPVPPSGTWVQLDLFQPPG